MLWRRARKNLKPAQESPTRRFGNGTGIATFLYLKPQIYSQARKPISLRREPNSAPRSGVNKCGTCGSNLLQPSGKSRAAENPREIPPTEFRHKIQMADLQK